MMTQPYSERQAETMFLLGNDIVRKKPAKRFLEKITQLGTLELELGFQPQGKSHHFVTDKGKDSMDPCQFTAFDHFGQVVVSKGKFSVKSQHFVYQAIGLVLMVYLIEKIGRVAHVYSRQEFRGEDGFAAVAPQQ